MSGDTHQPAYGAIEPITGASLAAGTLLEPVVRLCKEAGRAIEQVRREGFSAEYKDAAQHDPVTAADHRADDILRRGLATLLPGSAYFGEESARAGDVNSRWGWIVDPLDGTREFVAGIPEYAVSVLLQHDGRDILAVIHNPASNTTIAGHADGITCNGKPAHVSKTAKLHKARALASRTEIKAGEWDRFDDLECVHTGSVAWKCALVAAGRADLTFSLRPRHVWDVGAGFALVRWAGGCISDIRGQPIHIRPTRDKVRCFVASNSLLHHDLLGRLAGVPLGPDRRGP